MYKTASGRLVFSPTDLVNFLESPFASWMDRYAAEHPDTVVPDERDASDELLARAGDEYEQAVLGDYRLGGAQIAEIAKPPRPDAAADSAALEETGAALVARVPVIYQARLENGPFAGYSDFLELRDDGRYEVWDTKLSRTPKPRYPIQLCAYTEMLAAMTGEPLGERFGVILGDGSHVPFRTEDFIHYYRALKARFLAMQDAFTGDLADRPDPAPRAGNGRWESHADAWRRERDHLIQVAGISVGQIRKLEAAGIATVAQLAEAGSVSVPRLAPDTRDKLVAQARLQVATRERRRTTPDAPPVYDLLDNAGPDGLPVGLGVLPAPDQGDVYFDMEGYPLVDGGLEYLFGACFHEADGTIAFRDWWAHDRAQERAAFEAFVDWVHARWKAQPAMHIYHYAAYEVSAVRRLSTRHNTRQDEVDDLLRHEVFVDLYQVVRRGMRIGEEDYALKTVERLYRPPRNTDVATAGDSIVEYNRWMLSKEPQDWRASPILRGIRLYNEDDCRSTSELVEWLRGAAGTQPPPPPPRRPAGDRDLQPEAIAARDERKRLEAALRARPDAVSHVLSDLVDFHRREAKPTWWRMFARRDATVEELRDDAGCIAEVRAVGTPIPDKRSLIQEYRFDPDQECKLTAGERSRVMFTQDINAKFTLHALDADAGVVHLKIGTGTLRRAFGGAFPAAGSLIPDEYVSPDPIPDSLAALAAAHMDGQLPGAAASLLTRSPISDPAAATETPLDSAIRIAGTLAHGSFSIQGPPGTGKTYTAARLVAALMAAGKTVGVSSNSHKVVFNLLRACGAHLREGNRELAGIKVGSERDDQFFAEFGGVAHVASGTDARAAWTRGIVAGTAWLFSRPDWAGALDYLLIDEAGQVSLANAIAMSRAARNVILLGDQMQLEQPLQGAHPGDSGLSVLQYALKDLSASREDTPVFHAVVPPELGVFLRESHRMHPDICRFVSESIYESRLTARPDCARHTIALAGTPGALVTRPHGIAYVPVEHEGNVQRSDEEVDRVVAVFRELFGRPWTNQEGHTRPLALDDFLFVAPYNAQVRALKAALPADAKVGSVDRFQGQEAAVCVTSLCASYGEYGSRGLAFILDRNRMNVALSRAKCLAVFVGDPRLAIAVPHSIAEMRLINLFAKVSSS